MIAGRRVTVHVPDGRPAAGSLPLLVLHDGQNLFDGQRAYAGETWRVAETLDAGIADGTLAPCVVAGIDHAGSRRVQEFGPGASRYGRWLVRELLPVLRTRYGTTAGPEHTWMGGSSMGGLVTLQIASMFPDVFGGLLVFSPSVWWNRRAVLRTIRHPGLLGELFGRSKGLPVSTRVWLSIGTAEGEEAVADARRLRDTIVAMRRGNQSGLRYVEFSGGTHSEAAWAGQWSEAMRFVHPGPGVHATTD